MTFTIKHQKSTGLLPDWTQATLDSVIAGNPPPLPPAGTTLSSIVLPSDFAADHVLDGTIPASNLGAAGSDTQVQFNNAGAFGADSNFVWDNINKRLGIGVTSPSARLQVRGSGATSSTFGLIVENSSAAAPFSVRDDGNLYLGASATGAIISATDGTDAVVVTGNCGIRYRSALTLTSTGSDHFFRNYQGSRSATSGASRLMYFTGSFAPTSGTGTYEAVLIDGTLNQTGGAHGITRGVYVNPTLTSASSYRAFESNNSTGWAFYANGTAPSFFNGNIGIGVTAPSQRLQVEVTDNTTNGIFVRNNSTGTAAAGTLNVVNASSLGLSIRAHAVAHTVWPDTTLVTCGQPNGLVFNTSTSSPIIFLTSNTERMRVTSAGLLGIGTTTPTASLDINSNTLRLRTARTPASATASGNAGDFCWDADYFYICTATNTWRRVAHATW